MQLVYEAVAIGVLVVIVGVVVSNVVGMFHNGTKTACRINTNTIIPLEAVVTIVSP